MTTATKPHQSDRLKNKVSERKFRRNPLLWFILASLLVHGMGFIGLVWLKRSPIVVQEDTNPAPIDFIVLPPETSTTEEPNKTATNSLPPGETQSSKEIEPPPKPPTPTQPETPAQAVPKPAPQPPSPPITEFQPVTPPPVTDKQNNSEILSGSDPAIETTQTPEAEKPPANDSQSQDLVEANQTPSTPEAEKPPSQVTQPDDTPVATRLPPKPTIPPTTPNATPPTDSGAASLLGGKIERSLEEDKGDSFFDIQADANQQAYNPALLNEQQNIDMRKYFSEVQRRVRGNWNPKFAMEEYTTVLNFSIQSNGQITGLQVFQTSGNPNVDREALEAIQNSGPFPPLPASFPLDSVNIGFNFNIYLY
ncbi:MAG: energy transducer TonB [Pleurocapsa sp.]